MDDQYVELQPNLIFWKDPIRKEIPAEDINSMATSFMMHGQIEPIVVEGPDQIGKYEGICGQMRYEAVKHFQGKPILARVHKFKHSREKREWQLAENLHRRDLTAMQRAEAYKELYDSMRAEYGGEVKDKNIVFTIAKRQEELTGEKPAERTVEKYIQVARELPEDVKKSVTGDAFGIRHAEQLLRLKDVPDKQLELAEKFAEKPMTVHLLKRKVTKILSSPPPPLPIGEFNVIYADPPWEYEFSLTGRGDSQTQYVVMATQEISSLEIPSAKDAVLFLWATNPKLEEAFQVLKAWGFEYRTNIVWVKDKFGTGYYVRGQHELLLIGKKGNMPIPAEENRPPSVLMAPRKEHSEKPQEVYGIIEKMFPNCKYLELFARGKRLGWECWGNESREKTN